MKIVVLEDHKGIVDEILENFNLIFGNVHFEVFNNSMLCLNYLCNNIKPDFFIMDLRTDDSFQFDILSKAVNLEIQCVIYSGFSNRGFIEEIKNSGAIGYVNKSSGISELAKAIEGASRNTFYMCPSIEFTYKNNSYVPKELAKPILTNREMQILDMLMTGLSNDEIADNLNIGFHSIRADRRNMLTINQCTLPILIKRYLEWFN
jgi:hypothetical protein